MTAENSGPFIVGFNGPPRSGKDTIAQLLHERLDHVTHMPVHRRALAATMRDGAMAILGLAGGDRYYNDIKDQPLEVLDGGTFRRFMIDMSESFVKGIYGQDFWARLLYDKSKNWWYTIPSVLIVTDIGFKDEVEYLCERSSSYLNVRLDRPGTDFSKDSRGYVCAQTCGGIDFALTNDSTPEEAVEEILTILSGRLKWPVL